MKLTKAVLFSVLAAGSVVASGSAFAQDSTNAPESTVSTNALPPVPRGIARGASMERLAQILNLTDAQKAQVQPILQAERQKMRDLRNDTSLSADDRRSKMKEIRNDTSAQLQPILTPEQYAKWQNMTHSRRTAPSASPSVSTNTPAGSAQ